MKEQQAKVTPHIFLDEKCMVRFIRKSDDKVIQAKYSVYGNELIWVVEKNNDGVVIKSDINTIDEFNNLYKTEEGWEEFK